MKKKLIASNIFGANKYTQIQIYKTNLHKITTVTSTKLPISPPHFRHFYSLRHFHKHLVCNPTPRCSFKTRHSFGHLPNYPLNKPQLPSKLPIYPPPVFHFSSLRQFHKHVPRCSYETRDSFGQLGSYPKPSEVKRKKMWNSVQLIGCVASPVILTHVKSGQVLGSTRLAFKKSRTDTSWISLRFWGELAHIAHQHLQTGNMIYVFGHLQSDTVRTEDGKKQLYYEVVVHQLNFVKKISPSPVSVYDESYSSMSPGSWCAPVYHDSFWQSSSYLKPSEVKWKKELCNTVHFIGFVGFPVELTHLKSGKVVGSTRLGVKKFPTDTSWFALTFWNELAHIAHQHLQKGNMIYVSGRLLSNTVKSEGKQRTYYEVVVQQLNFVENCSPSPVSVHDETYSSIAPAGKFSNSATPTKLSIQELWQAFFANPTEWWDDRNNKKNPKAPDFKHKDTGEALWIEGRYNPPWVKSQLEILDSRMQSYRTQEDEPGLCSYLNGGL